ncbi:hypothetical protein BsWGS_00869 [Bradybaena similaris]
MSHQPPQRVKPSGSPSLTKQGPLKAVRVFSLRQNRNSSSPTLRDSYKLWPGNSPDKLSTETKSSGSHLTLSQSPTFNHKEKSRGQKRSPVPGKLRASSVDTVVPSYLTGQWPKDINSFNKSDGVFACDKSTQTVEMEYKVEKKKKGHRRSASFGQGDQMKLQFIKQHLQKSKEGSKYGDGKQRSSPVPGNHSALSMTAPPALCLQQTKSIHLSARHSPRQNMNRYQRNSVEGLNTEIEKLVSSFPMFSLSAADDDGDVFKEIPDGHRAPPPEVIPLNNTRSVNTQTPSHMEHNLSTTSIISTIRCSSISPSVTPRSGSADIYLTPRSRSDSADSKSSKGEIETSPEPSVYLSSPKLVKSCPFVREPPDGCEKVTVVEELRRPQIKEPMLFAVKPNQFVFKPSQGSAFCPLTKRFEFSLGCNVAVSPALSSAIDE